MVKDWESRRYRVIKSGRSGAIKSRRSEAIKSGRSGTTKSRRSEAIQNGRFKGMKLNDPESPVSKSSFVHLDRSLLPNISGLSTLRPFDHPVLGRPIWAKFSDSMALGKRILYPAHFSCRPTHQLALKIFEN